MTRTLRVALYLRPLLATVLVWGLLFPALALAKSSKCLSAANSQFRVKRDITPRGRGSFCLTLTSDPAECNGPAGGCPVLDAMNITLGSACCNARARASATLILDSQQVEVGARLTGCDAAAATRGPVLQLTGLGFRSAAKRGARLCLQLKDADCISSASFCGSVEKRAKQQRSTCPVTLIDSSGDCYETSTSLLLPPSPPQPPPPSPPPHPPPPPRPPSPPPSPPPPSPPPPAVTQCTLCFSLTTVNADSGGQATQYCPNQLLTATRKANDYFAGRGILTTPQQWTTRCSSTEARACIDFAASIISGAAAPNVTQGVLRTIRDNLLPQPSCANWRLRANISGPAPCPVVAADACSPAAAAVPPPPPSSRPSPPPRRPPSPRPSPPPSPRPSPPPPPLGTPCYVNAVNATGPFQLKAAAAENISYRGIMLYGFTCFQLDALTQAAPGNDCNGDTTLTGLILFANGSYMRSRYAFLRFLSDAAVPLSDRYPWSQPAAGSTSVPNNAPNLLAVQFPREWAAPDTRDLSARGRAKLCLDVPYSSLRDFCLGSGTCSVNLVYSGSCCPSASISVV